MRTLSNIVLSILVLGLLAACGPATAAKDDLSKRQVKVTTTVGMITDIVKNVGGERVVVTGLMGPGVDPHLYKPSASDVQKLEGADIIFYGGLELEGRMTDTLVKLARRGKPAVAVSEVIPVDRLLEPEEFECKYDPHVWFDVTHLQVADKTNNHELATLDYDSKVVLMLITDAYRM